MMKFNTSGLVIKIIDIGEYDRLVTLLTPDMGVVKAFCRGVRRIKSRRLNAASLLTYSEFTISKNRENYAVDEALPIETFFGLREDVERLALAQYFCELFNEFISDTDESEFALRLILNSLYFLSKGEKKPLLIKAITELRLLSCTGFMPNLIGCSICGEYESDTMSFNIVEGTLLCENCFMGGTNITLPLPCIRALRHIIYSDFEKLFSFSVSDENIKLLSATVEKYMLSVTNRSFKSLDFFNTLF